MDGDRYRIQIRSEPTAEGEHRLDSLAAFDATAAQPLDVAVRAVEMNSVSIADDDAVNRIVDVFVKRCADAHVDEFAALDEFHRTALAVQQIDAHDLGVAVTVSISKLRCSSFTDLVSGARRRFLATHR